MYKKSNPKKEIGAVNTLRFYDTDLIARLNKRFNESENRHDHRNHFLTDLIEAGLNRREYENSLRDELLKNDAAMYQSIDALAERLLEFEKYIRTQFQLNQAAGIVNKMILCSAYNISEAMGLRKSISPDEVNSGVYDFMPERFKRIEGLTERNFVKND